MATHKYRGVLLIGLVVLLVTALLFDVQAGPAGLDLSDVVSVLLGIGETDPTSRLIVFDVRLPDALIALSVGAALGLAGVETQTILNNPLASPFTLGFSAFATFGASIGILYLPDLPGLLNTLSVPMSAMSATLLCGALVLAFVRFHDNAHQSIVLFGIALVFFGEALTAGLQYTASAEAVQEIVFWSVGNLTRAGWTEVVLVTSVVLLVLPFSLRDVWVLTLLRGGEEQARSLGVKVDVLRVRVLFRVAILTAFAVSFVGTIGFVGLVGPHIARLILGDNHRYLIPGAILCGALLLSMASWLSKSLIPGVIVPVGILTALIGVPVFLALIFSRGGVR